MKNIITLLLLNTCLFLSISAQITSNIESINEQLVEISTEKVIINQSIIAIEGKSNYEVTFVRETENIKKGKVNSENYILNLAFLDEKMIKRNSSKKEQSVTIKAKYGKIIKYIENENKIKFVKEVKFICPDIDAARILEKNIKTLVVGSKEQLESDISVPQTLQAFEDALGKLSLDFSTDKIDITQSIKGISPYDDYFVFKINKTKKAKEKLTSFKFSLINIDIGSGKISSSGKTIDLIYNTKAKDNVIAVEGEDGDISYTSQLEIKFDDIGKAYRIKTYLKAASDFLKEGYDTRQKSYKNCSNCSSVLKTVLMARKGTSINEDCDVHLSNIFEDGESEDFLFNWGDIDVKTSKLDYKKNGQSIVLKTIRKIKYIAYYQQEKLMKFTNTLEIFFSDVEKVNEAFYAIKNIAKNCKIETKIISISSLNSQLSEPFGDKSVVQSFEKIDNQDACSFLYTYSESGKKDILEEYELNLYDLNPKSVEIKVSGKKLVVVALTKAKEKIITMTNQDQKLEYKNKIEIYFDKLSLARTTLATLEELIKNCSK